MIIEKKSNQPLAFSGQLSAKKHEILLLMAEG